MVYCEFTGHCDICGANNLYVTHHFDHDENGEIINSRMVCIKCNDRRVIADCWRDYNKGGREILEYMEAHREEDMKVRAEIEMETKEFLEKRRRH